MEKMETNNSLGLNTLSSAGTSKNRKRVGRGIGSGNGKTAGRGHKGQKSRSGGSISRGFEGGQMPLQQRVPKFGFSSRVNRGFKEVNLANIATMSDVSLETLKLNRVIGKSIKKVKIFGVCEISQPITVTGLSVTKGARDSIEKAGGTIEQIKAKTPKQKFISKSKVDEKVSSKNKGDSSE
ncbi:MAG: 50S ribosomal protein L15 [Gammaproteobacteria bacterium]|nr:50S ribosomal protein L15 [Gammaproteobacteria bacterium]|tara:strand:+ start:845 stop:1387 length:543 start_codon:yes stop_codon:yes gene_type:complete